MRDIVERISARFLLRLGFGISYLYSGSDMFLHPSRWYGFMPPWFSRDIIRAGFTVDDFLKFQGTIEVIVGILFLFWFFDRWEWGRVLLRLLCVFVFVQMALILLFTGLDPITFRDIVFGAAAVALLALSFQER